MELVEPTKPIAPYRGGKRNLAGQIVARIDAIPHRSYVEPFCGMGGVFFRRGRRPACEVINDYNGEVANFFRILQRHFIPLRDELKFMLPCREEFRRLSGLDPAGLTDLERAVRFFYLQKMTFAGRVTAQSFGLTVGQRPRFNACDVTRQMYELHERLAGVVVENMNYSECLQRYDRSDTLFYLDPPYWNSEDDYGKGLFDREDFEKLADILANLKGRFILSINDVPEIRHIFGKFHATEAKVNYTSNVTRSKSSAELIISNAL